jgi:catechol-2,3-dioxygenase
MPVLLIAMVEFAAPGCQAQAVTPGCPGAAKQEETSMAMQIGHVHIKTYDPKKTAQFYIDNFGATMKNEAPNGNIQLNLHGLQLNVTTISSTQNRKQMMGIEHIALQTDNYASDIAKLRSNGAHVMLEQVSNGRHVAFIEAPDGAQMELIEKTA